MLGTPDRWLGTAAVMTRNNHEYCDEIENAVWNKLYKSRIFDELRFPEGRVFEDAATTYCAIMQCNRFVSIPYIAYHYVMREGSITHVSTMKNLADFWIAQRVRYNYLTTEIPHLVDGEILNGLAKGPASAISWMWRWAYANSPEERAAYADLLREMQIFEREVLRNIDKRNWSVGVSIPLLLVRSRSTAALAIGYCANQIAIKLFPKKSSTQR